MRGDARKREREREIAKMTGGYLLAKAHASSSSFLRGNEVDARRVVVCFRSSRFLAEGRGKKFKG